MSYIGDLGMQTASGIVGAGLGLALQRNQDQRQISQQQKLQTMQIQGQKEMTDYQMMKQLQMWKDTNYNAQMEQLKIAGLNPGLIYGMGGAGGTTTGQGTTGVSAGHAPAGGGEAIHAAMAMSQMGLMRAQRDNLDADTASKGQDIPLKQAHTGNIKADTILKGIDARIKDLDAQYLQGSLTNRLEKIENESLKSLEELDMAVTQKTLDRLTMMEKVKQLQADVALKTTQNLLAAQHIDASEAEVQKWATELSQAWDKIDLQEGELLLKNWEAGIRAKYPGMFNVAGRILNEAAHGIGKIFKQKTETHEQPQMPIRRSKQ